MVTSEDAEVFSGWRAPPPKVDLGLPWQSRDIAPSWLLPVHGVGLPATSTGEIVIKC